MPISGSPTSWISQFTFAWEKWNAIQTRPGYTRVEYVASAVSVPRLETRRASAPSANPSAVASSGWISKNGRSCFSTTPASRIVIVAEL